MSSRDPQPTQRLGSMQRASVEAAQRYPQLSPRAANAHSSSHSLSSSILGSSLGSSLSSSPPMSASLGSSPYGVPLSSPRSRSSASDLPFAASGSRAPHASVSPRERSPVSSPGFAAASSMGVSLSSSLSRPPIQAFKLGEARASASVARASLQPSATVVHARSNLSSLRIATTAPERSPNPANYSPGPSSAPSPRSAAAAAAAFQGRFDRANASSAAVAPPTNRPLIAALLRTSPPAAVSISETTAFQSRLDHLTNLRASQDASAAAAAAANRPFSPSSSALAHALRVDAALPSPPEPMLLEALRSRILIASPQPHSKALQAAKQQQADDAARASLRSNGSSSGGDYSSFHSSDGDRPLTTRELDFDDYLESERQERSQRPPFGTRMLPDTDSPPRSNGMQYSNASPARSTSSSAVQSPSLDAAKSPSATPGRNPAAARTTPVAIVQSHSSYFVSSPVVRRQRVQHAQTQTPPSAQSRPPKGILHGQDLPPQPESEEEEEEEPDVARSSSSDDEDEEEKAPVATEVLRARAKAASAARASALRKLAAKEAREAEQKYAQDQQQHPSPVRTVRIEQPGAAVSPKKEEPAHHPPHQAHSSQQPLTRLSPTALRPTAPDYIPTPLVHATPLSPPPQRSPSPPSAAAAIAPPSPPSSAPPVAVVHAEAAAAAGPPPSSSSFPSSVEVEEDAQEEQDDEDEVEKKEDDEEEEPQVAVSPFAQPAPEAAAALMQPSPPGPIAQQQSSPQPPAPQPPQQPPQQQQQQPAPQNLPQPVHQSTVVQPKPKMYSPRPLPQLPQQRMPQPAVPQQQQQQPEPLLAAALEEKAEEATQEDADLDAAEADDVAVEPTDAVADSPPSATAIPPPSRPIRYASDPVVSLSPIVAASDTGLSPTPLALPASYTAGSSSSVHRSMRGASLSSGLPPVHPSHSSSPISDAAEIDESETLSSSQRSDRSSSLSVPNSPMVTPSPTRNRGSSYPSALPVGATGSLRRSLSSQAAEQQQNASPAQQHEQQQPPVRVLTHVDVIIVGAGLSGLTAASTLAEQGGSALSVAILEASGRVGGRTLTKHVTISNAKGWSDPASTPAPSSATAPAAPAASAAPSPPALPSSCNVQLDLGGQWVAPDHSALKVLAARWDCALVAQHHAGTKIAQVRGEVHHYSGHLPSYLGVWGLVKLQLLIWKIDRLARSLHEATSASSGGSSNLQDWDQAAYFDSMSCASWMSECISLASLRRLFEAVVRGLFGMEPSEVSMLYFIADVAASGCSLEKLIDIPGGNQESLFAGGSQQLSEKIALAAGFPGGQMENVHLFLDTPVRGVRMQQRQHPGAGTGDESHPVEVIYDRSGQSFVLRARHVILALAPVLYRHISFSPALPVARRTLAERNVMGSIIKIVLLYARAFWRETGFSGEAFGDCWTDPHHAHADSGAGSSAGASVLDSPIFQLYDGSKLVRPAVLDASGREVSPAVLQPGLVVFINGQAALEWSARSPAERRAAVLRQLARWFATVDTPAGVSRVSSVEVGSPLYWEEQDWTREAWVRGCPIAGFPPGALWAAAHALHTPAFGGRLQFAGTEESAVATGFMEGAVRAGQHAANAVLRDRKHRHPSSTKQNGASSSSSDATATPTEDAKLTYAPRRSVVEQHGVDGAPTSWLPRLLLLGLLVLGLLLMLRAYALSLPPQQQREFEAWTEHLLWSAVEIPFSLWRLWQSHESLSGDADAAASTPIRL